MTTTILKKEKGTPINKELWEEKKNKLKEKYSEMIDTDIVFEEENDDGLLEKINTKIGDVIGKTKKRMHKFIKII